LIVLAIAFCWAHRVGEWSHTEVKPIVIKKHQRPAKSLFRLGLEAINEMLFSLMSASKVPFESIACFLNPSDPEKL